MPPVAEAEDEFDDFEPDRVTPYFEDEYEDGDEDDEPDDYNDED